MKKIGFIGTGMMGEAIIGGMLKSGWQAEQIWGSDPSEDRRAYMQKKYNIQVCSDNQTVMKHTDVQVLAVKPQYFSLVLPDIVPLVSEDTHILSIMAGITTQRIEQALDVKAHVVRVMPNTPALVGSGTTAICAGSYADEADLALARQIFAAVGSVVQVEERLINAVSGVSGCGPAYIYVIIQALADGGVRMGLSRKLALQLAAETVRGAAQMVLESGEHPESLKDKVCSPGGTTIEAMYALEKAGLRFAMMEAVAVSTQKAEQL
jgi:pyrroline-5-carboxylate reductase